MTTGTPHARISLMKKALGGMKDWVIMWGSFVIFVSVEAGAIYGFLRYFKVF